MGLAWRCLWGHQWTGCLCARCGRTRSEGHEWKLVECRTRCARCGLVGEASHDWAGCACRVCGAEHHEWVKGICGRCGERCNHPQTHEDWDSRFFHRSNRPDRVCARCGARLE